MVFNPAQFQDPFKAGFQAGSPAGAPVGANPGAIGQLAGNQAQAQFGADQGGMRRQGQQFGTAIPGQDGNPFGAQQRSQECPPLHVWDPGTQSCVPGDPGGGGGEPPGHPGCPPGYELRNGICQEITGEGACPQPPGDPPTELGTGGQPMVWDPATCRWVSGSEGRDCSDVEGLLGGPAVWDPVTQSCVLAGTEGDPPPGDDPGGDPPPDEPPPPGPDNCPEGQVWNPNTQTCVRSPCPTGQIYNSATGQCEPELPGDGDPEPDPDTGQPDTPAPTPRAQEQTGGWGGYGWLGGTGQQPDAQADATPRGSSFSPQGGYGPAPTTGSIDWAQAAQQAILNSPQMRRWF